MKQLPEILLVSSLLVLNCQIVQAESSSYIDSLSNEADATTMKANEAAAITDDGPEPPVVPGAADDIEALSEEIGNRLKEVLTGSASKQTRQKKIAEIVSTAVKKGHEIDAIQNVVRDAMAELGKQENLKIEPEILEFTEKTVSQIVKSSKGIAQGDPNDPFIKSLNAEANETYVIEKHDNSNTTMNLETESIAGSRTSTVRTIIVLKGESLSSIAGKIYGAADKYQLLYEANRDVLNNPDLIVIGQILKIPTLP